MFSLALLECFTLVLAIGHLISPLVFIEVKVIQFLVFSVVQTVYVRERPFNLKGGVWFFSKKIF
jgi:hypothetical protein